MVHFSYEKKDELSYFISRMILDGSSHDDGSFILPGKIRRRMRRFISSGQGDRRYRQSIKSEKEFARVLWSDVLTSDNRKIAVIESSS